MHMTAEGYAEGEKEDLMADKHYVPVGEDVLKTKSSICTCKNTEAKTSVF